MRVPRPLLDYEKRFLLEDLKFKNLGGIRDLEKRLLAFAAAWARDQEDDAGEPKSSLDQLFEDRLKDWLMFHRAMLVEELVPVTLGYLRNNPEGGERSAYSHVLVDEYQDLNVSEQEFINLISTNAKLTIIGDENQSIYSFRHAHPEGITDFGVKHPSTTDVTLDICWRCPKNIVELANSLISHNEQKTNRELRAHPSNELANINIVQWPTMEQEAKGIAAIAKELVQQELVEPGRILILAPRKQFGYAVRDALRSIETPAHSFFKEQELEGNPKKLPESQVQQAFTLLTLAANPEDHVALRCWCGFGSQDLRAGAWSRIRDLCTEKGVTLPQLVTQVQNGKTTVPYGSQVTKRLVELSALLEELLPLQGQALFDRLFPEDDPEFEQIRDVMSEVFDAEEDARSILDQLRQNITQPELPTDVKYVRVMSLHKSKGLTADLVFVMGCVNGLIPKYPENVSARDSQRDLEEQRRLFYVAITRARKYLVISSARMLPIEMAFKMRLTFQQSRNGFAGTIASEFLNEFGPTRPTPITGSELLQKLRKQSLDNL